MTPDVSVVIVTYNSRRHLRACFETLRQYTQAATMEVIVVDNASSDGSAEEVERSYPWVRLVRRSTNGGLSAAVNDGVAVSTGTYAMALNPDTHIDEDALSVLAAYLREHPDCGIVAPKLLNDDGTLQMSCRAFPGYSTAFFSRYSLLTRLFPKNRYSRGYLMQDFAHTETRDVDWVSGAAMMFPRAVFDQIGGWDAGFFMFSEDVDFCRRVHDAGLRVVYHPAARVYHAIGVSKRAPTRIIIARHRSMWRYYRKHLRGNVVRDAITGAGIAGRCAWMLAAHALGNLRRR
jgi:GT2 family glycosyltransferase